MLGRTVLLLVVLALGLSPAPATAQSPVEHDPALIERLANLAPILDSRRVDMKSFAVRWHVWAQDVGYLRVSCAYAPPDRRACVVTHDDVPLFVAVDQDILVYGPVRGPRLLRGDWQVSNYPAFKMGDVTSPTTVAWSILTPGSTAAGIVLDLRSVVTRADRDRAVTRLGENRFVLTGRTADGGVLEAWVDLSNPAPYSRLTARAADGAARFEADTLVVDGPIRPDFFRFPDFQGKLGLAPATPVRFDNIGELMQQVMDSFFLRILSKSPAGRKQWEANVAQPPDWQRLEAQDAAWAPALKEIVDGMGPP